jgi:hypothetical protein
MNSTNLAAMTTTATAGVTLDGFTRHRWLVR